MKNIVLISKLLVLIAILMMPSFSAAAEVGKVEIVIRTAHELEEKKLDWERLMLSDPVMGESVVRTLEDSKLKLSLIDGSFILLTENSKTKIESIEPKGKSFIKMFAGKLRAVVKKVISKDASFSVNTPTAIVGVKGTDFAILLSKDTTEVIAFKGVVTVSNSLSSIPGSVEVKENYYTKVTRFAPPTTPVLLSDKDIEKIVARNKLSEEIFLQEFDDIKDKDIKDRTDDDTYNRDDHEIEGTVDDLIETPEDGADDIDDFTDTNLDDEIIIEPEIEDTDPMQIVDPPAPPPF